MNDLESESKECFNRQINPDKSEFECFFHYDDEKLFSAGFKKGYEFAQSNKKQNTMDLKSAIDILKIHNDWRRDDTGELPQVQPKILGEAIDLVVSEFENSHLKSVSNSFLVWWQNTGSAIRPNKNDDYETHAKRVCEEFAKALANER